MKQSRSKKYRVAQFARHDSGVDHGELTYRQALDMQHSLTLKAGSQRPAYVFRVEEIDNTSEVKEST